MVGGEYLVERQSTHHVKRCRVIISDSEPCAVWSINKDMIEFIDSFLSFPFWVVKETFIYGFGIVVYVLIFETLRHYKPWERVIEWWKNRK